MIAFTAMSFISKNDDEKKKKYHVIHQKDGEMKTFDTIVPMNSNYSVKDFLADKGISDENVEIINVPKISEELLMFHGDEGAMVFDFDHEFEWAEEGETVKIIAEEVDGEMKVKKFVNGEEVELTEEELENIHHNKHGDHLILQHGDGHTFENANGERVEIKVEKQDDGTVEVRKWVNGEEVEVSEEELDEMHALHHGQKFMIKLDSLDIDMDEIMKEMEIELKALNMDSLMQTIKIDIEKIVDMEELENGEKQMIIKIEGDMQDLHKEMEELHKEMEMHNEHVIRVESDQEDFTIVIVTEDYDEDAEQHTEIRMEKEMSDNNFTVYPNPSSGQFTVEFDQDEKVSTTVEVVNAAGKTVFKDKLGKFEGKYRKEIDLEKNGPGTYIIQVKRGDEIEAHKIVLN